MIRAVLFDVDFTLIYPGPTFRGEGYQAFCERYGMTVDPSRFAHAVASAAPLLDGPDNQMYDAEIFVRYTRHIIEQMGGIGESVDACAREIYDEWAGCHHFELYDEVPDVLRSLAAGGLRIGLVSNSHRSLESFRLHFDLGDVIAGAVSSSEHGYMKPHPSIFRAALGQLQVAPRDAVMVGDSLRQDVDGARAAGMHAVLLHRDDQTHPEASRLEASGVAVVRSLDALVDPAGPLSRLGGRHWAGELSNGSQRA
jgi:putative hydrolase of the HAD superfamily